MYVCHSFRLTDKSKTDAAREYNREQEERKNHDKELEADIGVLPREQSKHCVEGFGMASARTLLSSPGNPQGT